MYKYLFVMIVVIVWSTEKNLFFWRRRVLDTKIYFVSVSYYLKLKSSLVVCCRSFVVFFLSLSLSLFYFFSWGIKKRLQSMFILFIIFYLDSVFNIFCSICTFINLLFSFNCTLKLRFQALTSKTEENEMCWNGKTLEHIFWI